MGEKENRLFPLSFNRLRKVAFLRSRVPLDGGPLLIRERDDRLGIGKLNGQHLSESRQASNKKFPLADLLALSRSVRSLILLAALAVFSPALAQTTPNPDFSDTAVMPSFQREQPNIVHFTRLLRARIDETLDVLAVRGGRPIHGWRTPGDLRVLGPGDLLGVFLADRRDANLVYELVILSPPPFSGHIEPVHSDRGSLTVKILPEKGQSGPQLSFFFDPVSKSLRNQLEHAAFIVGGKVAVGERLYLIADNAEEVLALRAGPNGYEIVPGAEAERVIWQSSWRASWPLEFVATAGTDESEPFGPEKEFILRRFYQPGWGERPPVIVAKSPQGERQYAFPQSDRAKFERLRPEEAAKLYGAGYIGDEIGPHQIFDGLLWFGTTFYGSEGHTGVGGFGYFDPRLEEYTLFEPPEVVDWSISALLVEEDAVWLGLKHRGEWGNSPGGLVRWDRSTRRVEKFEEHSIIRTMARCGGRLCLGQEAGPAFFEQGRFERFVVVARPEGGWRAVGRIEP